MKRFITFLALCLFAADSFAAGKSFKIDGFISQPDGVTVCLAQYGNTSIIDRATVNGGRYIFEGIVELPVLCRIYLEGNAEHSTFLILEPGIITVGIDGSTSGTPGNNALSEMQRAAEKGSATNTYSRYVCENPNDYTGVVAFLFLTRVTNDAATLKYAASALSDAGRKNRLIAEDVEKALAAEVDGPGPNMNLANFLDFTVPAGGADRSDVKFSDYIGRGKYVLVDFWASWCGPCKREIPNIKAVYEEYAGDNFDVLSVAVWDKRADTEKAAAEHGVSWTQIYDAQAIPTQVYGINSIPRIMLFSPDGHLLESDLRGTAIAEAVYKYMHSIR